MKQYHSLPTGKLRRLCSPESFSFEDTSQIPGLSDVIGQQRAVDAVKFGLHIKMEGYNIYMAGEAGEGKTQYALDMAQKQAQGMKVPDDLCYVYNFEDANSPRAIHLPAGKGKVFKRDMEDFVKVLQQEIGKAFEGEDYEEEREKLLKGFKEKKEELVHFMSQRATEHGFKVRITSSGLYFIPIINGEPVSEEAFKTLNDEERAGISARTEAFQKEAYGIVRKMKELEKEAEEAVKEWENQIALFAVGNHIDDLKERYSNFMVINKYLQKVQEDILENLDSFREQDSEETQLSLPIIIRRSLSAPTDRYKVNLLVDNSQLSGAPVITDYNPTFYNLMGRVNYENEFGTITFDYSMIKPGLFHRANGGFLILHVLDVLNNPLAWEAIKRTLKTRQISIENMKEQMGLLTVPALKPEPVPVEIKIILIGSSAMYYLLYQYDRDFSKLFRIKADFDDEMEWNNGNVHKLAGVISDFCRKEGIPHFERSGVAEVVQYCSRLVQDQNKLTARFGEIVNILSEAAAWCEIQGSMTVRRAHVKKAIQEKARRSSKTAGQLFNLLKEGTIMIDTEGMVVGQINGLWVMRTGDYLFGKPSRITATTYMGKSGIMNIEREVDMSGVSHSKGVMILSGYIGQKYAQEIPLSLTASICFEQLYGGVDGDSASSTELYAILSSLSELPINQGIAVTGSVNQRGEIQPIGSVTQKIEGFFEICSFRGLTGTQGVVIPSQNMRNLVLNDDVAEAVEKGLFHIYAIHNVDEGMEILTGVSAGSRQQDGTYPEGSINHRVYRKLKRFAQTVVRNSQ